MKFSIGDKILLKRTGEEGYVTAYVNAQMLEVEVHGVTFPVYIEEVDHPYLKWFTDKKKVTKQVIVPEQLPVEKEKFRKPRLAKGIYLSFVPVFITEDMEDIVDHLKIYLLNELPVAVHFIYDVRFSHNSEFRHEGNLHPFGDLYLHSIKFGDMNDQPRFHWQFTDNSNPANDVAEGILRIKPVKLFEHISNVLNKNEPTFSYILIEEFAIKKKAEKPEKFEPVTKPNILKTSSDAVGRTEPPKFELDLHIEELVDDVKGLSNADIMQIQLDALARYLHLSILHRQERMIVIHGLGKGTLREAVHKMLKTTPEVSRYKNEWSGRYGFGATEIHFKY